MIAGIVESLNLLTHSSISSGACSFQEYVQLLSSGIHYKAENMKIILCDY
jgi:hypothetical protein